MRKFVQNLEPKILWNLKELRAVLRNLGRNHCVRQLSQHDGVSYLPDFLVKMAKYIKILAKYSK